MVRRRFERALNRSDVTRSVVDDGDAFDDDDKRDDLDGSDGSDGFDRNVQRPSKWSFPAGWSGPCPIQKLIIWKDENGNDQLPPGWQQILCLAANMARDWVNLTVDRINRIWGTGGKTRRGKKKDWEGDRLISRWLGTGYLSIRQIRVVRRRLRKMARFLRNGLRIVIIKASSGGRRGACYSQAAYTLAPRIYLCPTFFDTGRTVQRNAATLIHELTHRVVQARSLQPHVYFGHPRLGTQGVKLNRQVDLALSLARRRAVAARRSPVNYALLCFELGMRRPPVPRDFT